MYLHTCGVTSVGVITRPAPPPRDLLSPGTLHTYPLALDLNYLRFDTEATFIKLFLHFRNGNLDVFVFQVQIPNYYL